LTASGHREVKSRSCGDQLSNQRVDQGRSSRGRCARQVSTLPVAQQVKVNGSNKFKQYGHYDSRQLAVAGRSLNIVKPNPIHGRLLVLV
jgi:hypothetical protein